MDNHARSQRFEECQDAILLAISLEERGQFDSAREVIDAWGRGEAPKDWVLANMGQSRVVSGVPDDKVAVGVLERQGESRRFLSLPCKCIVIILSVVGILLLSRVGAWPADAREVRIGFFPNITHSQALLAKAGGVFDMATGLPVRWFAFNAGPSAIEALFAGAIDMAFTGPNPAINGYIKSEGKSFVIVAGGASGGAALVVRGDSGIQGEKHFDGKVIATPQLGNTQDVAARSWFRKNGYQFKEKGGNLTVMPLNNADQLTMFQKKEIDGAWTIEPWVSRLVVEGGGRVLLEEKTLWPEGRYVTTHLIVSRAFLERQAVTVKRILRAHVDLTRRIHDEPDGTMREANEQIRKETGKSLPEAVMKSAWQRVDFTWDPVMNSLQHSAQSAFEAGFLKTEPRLDGIYDLRLLNEVLLDKGLRTIQ